MSKENKISLICIIALMILIICSKYPNKENVEPMIAVALEPEPTEEIIELIPIEPTVIETIPMETLVEAKPIIPEEHKTAYHIWNRLKDNGFNDYVAAGIMGNIMAEVGGNTLYIQPTLYGCNGYYYGICQWNKSDCSSIHGADLESQLDYLFNTIEKEFRTFGGVFNCSFEEFMNLNDVDLAARRFAQVYERCDSGTYGVRQRNAIVAYEYFVNL